MPEARLDSGDPWPHVPDRAFRIDAEGNVEALNHFDASNSPAPLRLSAVFPKTIHLDAESTLSRARRTQELQALCFREGTDVYEARFCPGPDDILLLIRNVTELLAGEEALREQLSESQELLRRAPVGVFRTDALGSCTFINERWKELTQLTAQQALGNRWADAIHPDDRKRLFSAWEAAAEAGSEVTAEVRFQTASGGERHMLSNASPIFTDDGLTGYLGVLVDITERVEAQRETETTQTMMRRITDTTPLIIFISNVTTSHVGYVNRELERVLGYEPSTLMEQGAPFWLSLHHEDHAKVPAEVQQQLRTLKDGEVITRDVRLRHASGEWHWLRKHVTVFTRDAAGQVEQILTTAEDITAQKQADEKLAEAHAEVQLKASELQRKNRSVEVLHEMSELLQACVDDEEALAAIHRAMGQLFDLAGAIHLPDTNARTLKAEVVWGDASSLEPSLNHVDCWALRRGRLHSCDPGTSKLRCRHVHHDGGYICAPLNAGGETLGALYVAFETIDDHVQRLVRTVADAVALGLYNLQLRTTLRDQAVREPLTGLYNRRHMEASLQRELHQAERHGRSVAVVMLDVDHFKRFNDTHGHEAGDLCLKELAQHLASSVRRGDIACRFGGEEFALILPECPIEAARNRATRLCDEIRQLPLTYRGKDIGPITVSMGVSIAPVHGFDADTLVRHADLALYAAKRAGRNRVKVAPLEGGGLSLGPPAEKEEPALKAS